MSIRVGVGQDSRQAQLLTIVGQDAYDKIQLKAFDILDTCEELILKYEGIPDDFRLL